MSFESDNVQRNTTLDRLSQTIAGCNDRINSFLRRHGSTELKEGAGLSLSELIKRPELSYEELSEIDPERPELPWRVREQVNIEIKYKGYIERQKQQVEHFKKLERRRIPSDIVYDDLKGLRIEACQKLSKIRPENIGQAGRISGVSPADISVLLVHLEQMKKRAEQKND